MFITIYAGGMPFNGNTIPSGKSLGGSESAAYYISCELVKLGHAVTIFTSEQQCGIWDGVRYEWHGQCSEKAPLGDRFTFAMHTPQDVAIVQRHPNAFDIPINSKLNILWMHDLALHRNTIRFAETFVNTDKIFAVSNWHKHQINSVYSIDLQHIYATCNGVDYAAVKKALEDMSTVQRTKRLVFASRPERGLEELVAPGGIMEKLPDYSLFVAGYNTTTREMVDYYRYLYGRCNDLPNVSIMGNLGKSHLYQLLASAQMLVYPTMFEDTSNILCMEAAACGAPIIGMHNGALPETCKVGTENCFGHLVFPENGKVNIDNFVKTVRDVCENQNIYNRLVKSALKNYQSWEDVAKDWEQKFDNFLREKSSNPAQLVKHLEHNSDVVAMRKKWPDSEIEKITPGFKKNYRFLIEDDFKEHYRRYYEYEKARGVNYGPESLNGNSRFECISSIVEQIKPKTVLDYGCAHGHYTVNLAKRFPNSHFFGLDLAGSNIDIACKWATDDQVGNTSFTVGDHLHLPSENMDLIIAAEVLEHVANPQGVVGALLERLMPGGVMCISVPYGPWEAAGYELHPGWRAHIHHLERQDLLDMFGHFPDYKCLALPHSGNLGHYVLTFTKPEPGAKCGQIDYGRKLTRQAPRQSLSVCMIARDEELNIGRCLSNIAPYADEIIVGVDKNTTDNTRQILDKFGAIHFDIESPIDIGFDEARNQTIAKSVSDWILWIDADETLENIHLLPYYLRQNIYDGYAIKQHHFSTEPAQILQTDVPCRLFRRDKQIKFYGVVHEHPSKINCNEGPGRTYIIPNIHIAHTGYATESKRRERFKRNFPLMKRDLEKYPDRILSKFLYVRDLSHCITYQMEKNGNRVDSYVKNVAEQGINLWIELIKNENRPIRFIHESIPYASRFAEILGGKIKFMGKVNSLEIKGIFMDTKTLRFLMDVLTYESSKIYEEKYL